MPTATARIVDRVKAKIDNLRKKIRFRQTDISAFRTRITRSYMRIESLLNVARNELRQSNNKRIVELVVSLVPLGRAVILARQGQRYIRELIDVLADIVKALQGDPSLARKIGKIREGMMAQEAAIDEAQKWIDKWEREIEIHTRQIAWLESSR